MVLKDEESCPPSSTMVDVGPKREGGAGVMTELPGVLAPSAGSLRILSDVTAVGVAVSVVRLPAQEHGWLFPFKGACASNMLAQSRATSNRFFTPILNSIDSTPAISFSIFTSARTSLPPFYRVCAGFTIPHPNSSLPAAPFTARYSQSQTSLPLVTSLAARSSIARNTATHSFNKNSRPGGPLHNSYSADLGLESSTHPESCGNNLEHAGKQRRAKREIPEKTPRQGESSGTIPTRENPGATPPGIEPGSPGWEASSLDTTPPRPPFLLYNSLAFSVKHLILVIPIKSCRTMPLVGGFSRGSPVPPSFHSVASPFSPQSPSSALKTTMLRAAQISSLTDSNLLDNSSSSCANCRCSSVLAMSDISYGKTEHHNYLTTFGRLSTSRS
ncbi:hypothetical protein PR048_032548 [Dryococelus australis]|uniref:Uncharacterized protein n=1 Tax=Dryococelus australis TaxID=614101 RepID=A0ABQ9G3N4_9NEOP|nr:hypothetical protein PR048_032548 [Dryococelus australis]